MRNFKFYFFLTIMLNVSAITFSQTFHGIIFANTNDSRIGNSVQINMRKMETEFAGIATATNMTLNANYYEGSLYSKASLMKCLNSITFKPNDIVFFYHSGHGARAVNDRSKWPQLCLGDYDSDFVSLNKVLEIIKRKSPRPQLIIVMSQSCNNEVAWVSAKESISESSTQINSTKSGNYQRLFSKLKGTIIVSSSMPGQYSYSTPVGSTFTNAFLRELQNMVVQSNVNWNTLFERTKKTNAKILGHNNSIPQWNVNVNPITKPVKVVSKKPKSTNSFINQLLSLADKDKDKMQRIKMVNSVLSSFFESEYSKVEIIGKNGKTLIERQTAIDFLKHLSTTRRLDNIAILEKKTNTQGKIKSLKLHEVYRNN